MQRGTIAFLRSVSLEAIGLGAHITAGAHAILLQAEDIISTSPPTSPLQNRGSSNVKPGQPKDARQGIQQAFETITDGFGKSASALVDSSEKVPARGWCRVCLIYCCSGGSWSSYSTRFCCCTCSVLCASWRQK